MFIPCFPYTVIPLLLDRITIGEPRYRGIPGRLTKIMHHRNRGQAKETYIMNCITSIASNCNCHTTSLLITHNIIKNQMCILDLHYNDYLIRLCPVIIAIRMMRKQPHFKVIKSLVDIFHVLKV